MEKIMSLYLRILQASEIDEVLDFEMKKMVEQYPDEMERTIKSWHSRARKEALVHYLPMGWSFVARDRSQPSPWSDEGLMVGYFIAQPLLFLDGQTQSLWVEHIQYSALQARDELCDLAYRLSREKHFQRVFFPQSQNISNAIKSLKAEAWDSQVLLVKTTKV